MIYIACLSCNKEVKSYSYRPRKYCSPKCFYAVNNVNPEVRRKNSIAKTGKGNPNWKEKPSYSAIHLWLRLHYGSANKCVECGTKESPKYEWANISGRYLRDVKDYKQLCAKCHDVFDDVKTKHWISRRKKSGIVNPTR